MGAGVSHEKTIGYFPLNPAWLMRDPYSGLSYSLYNWGRILSPRNPLKNTPMGLFHKSRQETQNLGII